MVGVVVEGAVWGGDVEVEEVSGGVVLGGDGGGSAGGLLGGFGCGVGDVVDGLSDEWVAGHRVSLCRPLGLLSGLMPCCLA